MVGALQPAEQLLRVSDGGGEPDALQRAIRDAGEPFEKRK
jgi:hypothetical protein